MDGKTPETGEKKKSLLIFSCICAVGICVLIAYIVNILTPLDRILDYRVQVKAQEDGALEITYQYRWKVLNDSKEGPLTWVSLGIPNSRYELLGYTGAISGLKNGFYGDGLIKFELDRAYKKGEVAEFGFTRICFAEIKGTAACLFMILCQDGLMRLRWNIIFLSGRTEPM